MAISYLYVFLWNHSWSKIFSEKLIEFYEYLIQLNSTINVMSEPDPQTIPPRVARSRIQMIKWWSAGTHNLIVDQNVPPDAEKLRTVPQTCYDRIKKEGAEWNNGEDRFFSFNVDHVDRTEPKRWSRQAKRQRDLKQGLAILWVFLIFSVKIIMKLRKRKEKFYSFV